MPYTHFSKLRDIYFQFFSESVLKVKQTEKITNHDVEAVKYFVNEKFDNIKYLILTNSLASSSPYDIGCRTPAFHQKKSGFDLRVA